MPSRVNGFSVAYATVGGVVLWSGIRGSSISDTFRSVLAGSSTPPVTEQVGTAAGSSPSAPAAGDTGAHSASAAANQAIGQRLAAGYGWGSGQQWQDLVSLWNRESGWNNTAQNPTSTAYGIAQFLDSTWAGTGTAKTSNPTAQIFAGLAYIKARYGSPSAAWAHEQQFGWY